MQRKADKRSVEGNIFIENFLIKPSTYVHVGCVNVVGAGNVWYGFEYDAIVVICAKIRSLISSVLLHFFMRETAL